MIQNAYLSKEKIKKKNPLILISYSSVGGKIAFIWRTEPNIF